LTRWFECITNTCDGVKFVVMVFWCDFTDRYLSGYQDWSYGGGWIAGWLTHNPQPPLH